MTGGYGRVEAALKDLAGDEPDAGRMLSVRIGPDEALERVLLAKDDWQRIHLMVFPPDDRRLAKVRTGRVLPAEWRRVRLHNCLDVVCSDERFLPTFHSLIGEMLDRVDGTGKEPIDELTAVLSDWRTAVLSGGGEASREAIIGLHGELIVLAELARLDPGAALGAWRGPVGGRHDFARTNALEIKTFAGSGAPRVTIHGERQLDPPDGGTLHLLAMRLDEADSGDDLQGRVDAVVRAGVPQSELVEVIGSEVLTSDHALKRFALVDSRLHEVTDDFPGIRAARFGDDALRAVERVSYTLLLDACPARLGSAQLVEVLKTL